MFVFVYTSRSDARTKKYVRKKILYVIYESRGEICGTLSSFSFKSRLEEIRL